MVDIKKVQSYIAKDLYNFEETTKCLSWAFNSGENIILYGLPGYGKSVGAELFCNYLLENNHISEKPYIMNFSQFSTEELLLGGLDIKKFQEEGTIWYNLLNSFVNYEVFIAEELFDARILTVLKDILTSKQVRLGNQIFPIKTKMIIACTNKTREEVITDNSTAALFERFVYEVEVAWQSWEIDDYINSLLIATKEKENDNMKFTAYVCTLASRSEDFKISPRTAYKVYNSVKKNGYECLIGFKDLKPYLKKGIEYLEQIKEDKKNLKQILYEIEDIKKLEKVVNKKQDINLEDIIHYIESLKQKEYLHIRDSNHKLGEAFLLIIKDLKESLIQKGLDLFENKPQDNLYGYEEEFLLEYSNDYRKKQFDIYLVDGENYYTTDYYE